MRQSNGAGDTSPDEVVRLRREIEQIRNELGSTVEALAARADVKSRAQEAAAAARQQIRDTAAVTAARAKDQVRQTAGTLNAKVGEKLPGPARKVPPLGWLAALAGVIAVVAFVRGRRKR